jgi:hypothetical protein
MASTRTYQGNRIPFMRLKPSTTRERNAARTIIALERLVADSTAAPKMRRAATLRLGRLRAASRPAITTRTTPTAPAPSEEAKFEAAQSFNALARQRTALFRNRHRTRGEQEAFNAMVFLMPATMPPDNDPTAWRNFVAVIDGLLSEIKNIKYP